MYSIFLLVLIFTFYSPLFSMKVPRNVEFIAEDDFEKVLKKGIESICDKYHHYKVFNPSNEREVRNMGFLAHHLNNNELKKKKGELHYIYLVTLKHINCLNSADIDEKYFFVDVKRLSFFDIHIYPETVKDKIAALIYYYTKISINQHKLLTKVPDRFHETFNKVFIAVSQSEPYRLERVIFLDKTEESGFFVLFRLVDQKTHLVKEIVYELLNKRQYTWDKECNNITTYYAKYRNWFIQQKNLTVETV